MSRGRYLDDVLGVCQEASVESNSQGEHHALVLGNSIGNQSRIESFLCRSHPYQEPPQVSYRQRIVVFHPESSGVVKGPVSDHRDHWESV